MLRWAGFGVGKKEPGSTLYAFWKKDGKCRVSSWRLRAPWQGESDTYSYISMENIASNFSISNRAVGANLQCTVRLPKKIPNINQNFTWATGTLSPDSLFERNDGFLGSPDESGKLILNNVASISKLSIFAVLAALMIL